MRIGKSILIVGLTDGSLIGWCGRLSLAIYAVHWIFVPFVDAPIFNYMLPLVQDAGLGSVDASLGSSALLPDAGPGPVWDSFGSGTVLQNAGLSFVGSTSASGFVLQSLVPFFWRTLCGLVAFVLIALLTLPAVRLIEKWCPWMMGRELSDD